tara:strand:- start:59 stop:163 length:105 start_codon:yes stop_codon:yes gene_type:complete
MKRDLEVNNDLEDMHDLEVIAVNVRDALAKCIII